MSKAPSEDDVLRRMLKNAAQALHAQGEEETESRKGQSQKGRLI